MTNQTIKKVLVTGGTGFLAEHIIAQLLARELQVKATVRNENGAKRLLAALDAHHIAHENLEIVDADLTKDEGWEAVMADVDGVLSVAAPVFFGKANLSVLTEIAKDGILRILRFASQSSRVQRVVMTGNFGAVGFSNKNPKVITTDEMWTNPDEPGLSPYEKSKLLAERAAWDFVRSLNAVSADENAVSTDGNSVSAHKNVVSIDDSSVSADILDFAGRLEFLTVNPVAIFGPSLDGHFSGSFEILTGMLSGKTARLPAIPLNIVDVRDVADLHIRALLEPLAAGQRFIASADGQIDFWEIAQLIKQERPALAGKISSKKLPDFAVKFASLFNRTAREGKLLLELNRHVSTQKAQNLLAWKPTRNNRQIILDSVDSLAEFGQI